MLTCPSCNTRYPEDAGATCARDGSVLAAADAEAEPDTLIGQTVLDRYIVGPRIGVGAMGTVYRASQLGLDREVALKVLRPELSTGPETVARFQREARAMSLLTHPNTVRVFDFGATSDGLLLFAMELLAGESLTAKLARDGLLSVQEAVRILRQVLGSLAEAHSKGIVHRDLKPDNIFLTSIEGAHESVVKVLDFGIAKVVHNDIQMDVFETQAGTVFGTPRYMSPEQAQGTPLDGRSDLYSVGVLLYQLLTGSPPYTDEDAVVVMAKHIRERPAAPSDVAPERPIPLSLERVVLRALEKNPARRIASAEEFAERLARCSADIEALADARPRQPRSTAERVVRWARRAPRAPLLTGAAMVTISLATAFTLIGRSGRHATAGEVLQTQIDAATPARPIAAPVVEPATPAIDSRATPGKRSKNAVRSERRERTPAPRPSDLPRSAEEPRPERYERFE